MCENKIKNNEISLKKTFNFIMCFKKKVKIYNVYLFQIEFKGYKYFQKSSEIKSNNNK